MKTILVNCAPEETRMAIVESDELLAVEVERESQSHLVGNIYKGQVQNVLPGMQAAFVDIGWEKNAFLYIGDGVPHEGAQKTTPAARDNAPVDSGQERRAHADGRLHRHLAAHRRRGRAHAASGDRRAHLPGGHGTHHPHGGARADGGEFPRGRRPPRAPLANPAGEEQDGEGAGAPLPRRRPHRAPRARLLHGRD